MAKFNVISNVIFLLISNFGVRMLGALAAIFIARYLGSEEYGLLSVALSFSVVASYFTDLGLTNTLIREGTKKNANVPLIMGSFVKTRLVFTGITLLLSFFIINMIYDTPYVRSILYVMLFPSIIGSSLQGIGASYFQLIQKMKYTALIRSISGITSALSLFIGIYFKLSLLTISGIYGFSSLIGGFVSLYLLSKFIKVSKGWDPGILIGLSSFIFGSFFVLVLPQMGLVLLERVASLKEVGYYSAAFKIPIVLYQIPGVCATAFYPLLFHYWNQGEVTRYNQLVINEIKVMSFIGIVASLPFIFYSEWWVQLLFGKQWLPAAKVLTILSIIILIQSINFPLADALTTSGKQRVRTLILALTFFTAIPLYLVLGDYLGSIGAAVSTIILEIIQLILYIFLNPQGLSLFYKGIRANVGIFIVSSSLFYMSKGVLDPIFNILLITGISFVLFLQLNKEIKQYIIQFLKSKLRGRINSE